MAGGERRLELEFRRTSGGMLVKITAQHGRWGGAVLTQLVRSTDFEVAMTQVQIPVPALNSCVALGRFLSSSRSLSLICKTEIITIGLLRRQGDNMGSTQHSVW